MRKLAHQAQQGFMTIAQNTDSVNYLNLAYVQAMSIKLTMPGSLYAVAVDQATYDTVTEQHRQVFDYVILIEHDLAQEEEWKLSNEWQVFDLTPFKETIKLESDIVFTRSIAHWWNTFRTKSIVLSTGCKDYQQRASNCRTYRQLFDDNDLPDTYSGLMYFRFTKETSDFFLIAREIFKNWSHIQQNVLKNCHDIQPTTDVVYALTAKILGVEKCTIPSADFINFVHMKPAINNFSNYASWTDLVVCELDLPMIRINNINQYHPLHYYEKSWVTTEVIQAYEQKLFTSPI